MRFSTQLKKNIEFNIPESIASEKIAARSLSDFATTESCHFHVVVGAPGRCSIAADLKDRHDNSVVKRVTVVHVMAIGTIG